MDIKPVPNGKKRKNGHRAADAMKPQWTAKQRMVVLLVFFAFVFTALAGRLFFLQIIDGEKLQQKALGQWTRSTPLSAARGEIVDCNGIPLSKTGPVYKIIIWPQTIARSDSERIARELSETLELDYASVLSKVQSTTLREVVIKRQVDDETVDKIRQLKLGSGVGIANDSKRYYPYGTLLSQVLGFTNIDNEGQSGLELSYNKYLSGEDGKQVAEVDSSGNVLTNGVTEYIAPTDGCTLWLTVDKVFQSYLENALDEALRVNNAANAQGIIMDVNTGAIVAIASKPDYDPNNPPRSDLELLAELSRNRIVTDAYEPGSTFKILTLAAALDSGNTSLDEQFYCNGGYIVNGERIKCWRHAGHGSQNLTEAAENSCNCCFMKLALSMGVEEFYDYLYAFGLGQSTGSGLAGESAGIVTHQKYVTDNDLARIGFGQSIAVTPIQLISAVSAAVNGGELHTPYIVDSVIAADGSVVFSADTEPIRRVISAETSETVRKILQSVVDNGTGKNAQLEGYYVGGKTGTAQKYDKFGQVSTGSYICSFIGFAPADEPRYACLILVDEPKVGSIFGSTVAAPYVRRVLADILPYSGILPSHQSETVILPDLSGKTAAQAAEELAAMGVEGIYECADELVTLQVPAAGQSVNVGSAVLLYTGYEGINEEEDEPLYVTVPNLMDMTPLQAHDALAAVGLKMICNPDDPFGVVLAQGVFAGTQVEYGSSITVYFGIKPEEETPSP